jgi:two-component system sensor histidine kinase AtoS
MRVMKLDYKTRIFALVFLSVLLPLLLLTFLLKVEISDNILKEKQDKLFGITRQLDHYLVGSFAGILARRGAESLSRDEKVRVLNEELREITDFVVSGNPGVGAGYYHRKLDAFLTYGPSAEFQHMVGQSIFSGHQGYEVMETGKPLVQEGELVRGHIMNCMWPLVRQGEVIGHIWANEPLDQVEAQLNSILFKVYGFILLLLLTLFLTLGLITSTLMKKIVTIKQGIEAIMGDPNQRLVPIGGGLDGVVDKINELIRNLNLFKSYNKYILNSTINGVLSISNEGMVVRANKAFFSIFDHLDSAIIGQHFHEVFASGVQNLIEDAVYRNILHTSRIIRSGEMVLDTSSNIIRDDVGTQLGFLLVFRDITLLMRYQKDLKEKDRMALFGEMALGVVHEIKNPLTAVKGFAQMMRRPTTTAYKREEYLNVMDSELNRLNRLLNEMLLYGGKTPLQFSEEDIEQMLDKVISRLSATGRGVTISKIILRGKDFIISVDAGKILQVFDNILQNSTDALMDKRHKFIKVFLEADDKRVHITFVDNGCGIAKDAMEKIFTPFYTSKQEGTGFGLAICYKIVEQHGGKIEVLSKENYYTKVKITLPRKRA